jgi:DNA-binding NarL/FixJ family response regulator
MDLSVKTVEKHLTGLYRQIGVQGRLEAANYATRHPELLALPGHIAAQDVPRPTTSSANPIGILLVDDNLRYRHELRLAIGKVCPQALIYEAGTAEEAIGQLRHAVLQFAIVDVVLGDEDGIRCTRRLKALAPQLRIVLISAYPDREFHIEGLQAGAMALLDKKDLDAATLRQLIKDLLDGA